MTCFLKVDFGVIPPPPSNEMTVKKFSTDTSCKVFTGFILA